MTPNKNLAIINLSRFKIFFIKLFNAKKKRRQETKLEGTLKPKTGQKKQTLTQPYLGRQTMATLYTNTVRRKADKQREPEILQNRPSGQVEHVMVRSTPNGAGRLMTRAEATVLQTKHPQILIC